MIAKNVFLVAIVFFLMESHCGESASLNNKVDYSYLLGENYMVDYSNPYNMRSEAVRQCELAGMHLLSIETDGEWEAVKLWILINGVYWGNFWTSAVKEAGSTRWVWESSGEEVTNFHWSKSQPTLGFSDTVKHCIGFSVELGGWYDYVCNEESLSYFCEKEES
ncbi:perlucin-like [Neocloeon triangulifer]|uniref:perlucin-like n=1 Tax=Neocloeon triangulifer TaxID=2078957 RepID=UPI00286F2756|nr:perlucin-like [Neocloeon triangulifer]